MPVAIEAAQTGRDRRERRHALVRVLPLLDQPLQRRRTARRDGPLEHRGLHRVDDREDELLGHPGESPSGRLLRNEPGARLPSQDPQARVLLALAALSPAEQPSEADDHDDRERREQHRGAGGDQRGAFRVDRQGALRVRVEPRADPSEERARGQEAERGGGDTDRHAGPPRAAVVGDRARREQRAEHQADHQQDVHDGVVAARVSPAPAVDEAEDGHQDDDHEQECGPLQEREVRALEVDSEVGGGERSDQQYWQERADPDRRGDAETLQEGEEIVHGRASVR